MAEFEGFIEALEIVNARPIGSERIGSLPMHQPTRIPKDSPTSDSSRTAKGSYVKTYDSLTTVKEFLKKYPQVFTALPVAVKTVLMEEESPMALGVPAT